MNRRDLLLATMAAAQGGHFTPVQIQKAMFLVTRNLPFLIDEGPEFDFVPYDYGPFDRNVYVEAENLRDSNEAIIAPSPYGRWSTYAATLQGSERGQCILAQLDPEIMRYIVDVTNWVRAQSFGPLVKAIYDQYPEMRRNSVFRD